MQSVTQNNINEEDIIEAERLELNPETILKLIDLLFLCKDETDELYS